MQPTYAAYSQPTYVPVSYARPAYVQPIVRQVVYAQPAYVARPVNFYPVYRPVVAAYTPTYVASPVNYEVPVAQPVVAAGPKVWVHNKVYVQGQPIRNFLTAITP